MTKRLFGFINKVKEAAKILNAEEESEYEEEEKDQKQDDNENVSDISDIDLDEVEEILKGTAPAPEIDDEDKMDPELEAKRNVLLPYFESLSKIQNLFPAKRIMNDPDALIAELESIQQKQNDLISQRDKFSEILDAQRSLDFVEQDLKGSEENLNLIRSNTDKLKADLDKARKLKLAARSKAAEMQAILQQNSIRHNELKTKIENLIQQINDVKSSTAEVKSNVEGQINTNQRLQSKIDQMQQDYMKSREETESIQYEIDEENSKLQQVLEQLDAAQNQSNEQRKSYESSEISELEQTVNSLQRAVDAAEKQALIERNGMTVADIEKKLSELSEKHKKLSTKTDTQKEETTDIRKEISDMIIAHINGDQEAADKMKTYFNWSDVQINRAKEEKLGFWGKTSKFFSTFTDSWSSWLIAAADN